MDFNGNELVDAVSKVLVSKATVPTWNTYTQWELESRRRKLSDDRAAQYNVLQVLNSVKRAVNRTNYKVPPTLRSEHVVQELYKVDSKERRNAKAFINELNGKIRQLSVAYTVVTSSKLLAHNVIYCMEGHEPPMLKNKHGRWYKTPNMRNAYDEMLHKADEVLQEPLREYWRSASMISYDKNIVEYVPEPDFDSYLFTGKAIVYAGTTAGGWPVLLSLNCKFDLNGVIDGLPDSYRVIMFKPRKVTVTKTFGRPNTANRRLDADATPDAGGKPDEGLTQGV